MASFISLAQEATRQLRERAMGVKTYMNRRQPRGLYPIPVGGQEVAGFRRHRHGGRRREVELREDTGVTVKPFSWGDATDMLF